MLSPGQSPICHTSGLVRTITLVVPCQCEMIWPDIALFSSHSRSVNTAITVSVPGQDKKHSTISRFSCLKSQTQSHSSPPTSTQATGQLVAVQNNHPLALTVTAIPGEEGVPGPSSSPSSSSSTALHIPSTQDQGRGIRGAEEYIIEEIYLSIIFGILFLGHKTFILTRT